MSRVRSNKTVQSIIKSLHLTWKWKARGRFWVEERHLYQEMIALAAIETIGFGRAGQRQGEQ